MNDMVFHALTGLSLAIVAVVLMLTRRNLAKTVQLLLSLIEELKPPKPAKRRGVVTTTVTTGPAYVVCPKCDEPRDLAGFKTGRDGVGDWLKHTCHKCGAVNHSRTKAVAGHNLTTTKRTPRDPAKDEDIWIWAKGGTWSPPDLSRPLRIVSKPRDEPTKIIVSGVDTLTGKPITETLDLPPTGETVTASVRFGSDIEVKSTEHQPNTGTLSVDLAAAAPAGGFVHSFCLTPEDEDKGPDQ